MTSSHERLAEIRAVLAEIGDPPVHLWPLQLAIRTWVSFVATLDDEFRGEVDDFAHELSTRDYLDELSTRLPGYWSDYIEQALAPWDERFRAATYQHHDGIAATAGDDPRWWHHRLPSRWTRV